MLISRLFTGLVVLSSVAFAACGVPGDSLEQTAYDGILTVLPGKALALATGLDGASGPVPLESGETELVHAFRTERDKEGKILFTTSQLMIENAAGAFKFELPADLDTFEGVALFVAPEASGQAAPMRITGSQDVKYDSYTTTDTDGCTGPGFCSKWVGGKIKSGWQGGCPGQRTIHYRVDKYRRELVVEWGTAASTEESFDAAARFEGEYLYTDKYRTSTSNCRT